MDLRGNDLGSENYCSVKVSRTPAMQRGEGRHSRRRGLTRAELSEVTIRRFRQKIQITPTCWLWTGTKVRNGYGQVYTGDKPGGQKDRHYAHRVAYVLAHGSIPGGLVVMHTCDVPGCVNPAHLVLGTQQANIADRDAKGRGAKVKPTIRVISAEGVRLIRERRDIPSAQWANAFGVCVSHINRIRRGEKRKVD